MFLGSFWLGLLLLEWKTSENVSLYQRMKILLKRGDYRSEVFEAVCWLKKGRMLVGKKANLTRGAAAPFDANGRSRQVHVISI